MKSGFIQKLSNALDVVVVVDKATKGKAKATDFKKMPSDLENVNNTLETINGAFKTLGKVKRLLK